MSDGILRSAASRMPCGYSKDMHHGDDGRQRSALSQRISSKRASVHSDKVPVFDDSSSSRKSRYPYRWNCASRIMPASATITIAIDSAQISPCVLASSIISWT